MNDPHVIENLPILILYPHNRCNCRCVMCDVWKLESVQEFDQWDLERYARDIECLGVRWVVFSGGEPLMHSDLFRFSSRLRERGIRTTILTTGILLSKHASAVVRDLDDVIVSLDGPPQIHDCIRGIRGAFELLAAGVRALRVLKQDFPVAARSTIQRLNFRHLPETVNTAKELGLRSISFLAADVTSSAFNRPDGWTEARQAQVALSGEETRVFELEIERLIDWLDGDRSFVLETPEKLRRIARHFRAHLGLVEPAAPKCNAPWVSAVVESDGTVRPCFFHQAIGSLKEHTLLEALNSPRALEFRRGLDISRNPVCRRCVCSLYLQPAPESTDFAP